MLDAAAGRARRPAAERADDGRRARVRRRRRGRGRGTSPPPTGWRRRSRWRRRTPDALLIDVGSTTADVVPIADGRVAATGHNDLERLLAGELVYTGVLRTNLAAIAPRVPVRGGWCPVSSEYFAISADVHLVLGHLAPEAYDCPTPDGRAGHGRVRARADRPARVLRRRAARRRRRSTRSRRSCTASSCARLEEAARRVQRVAAARRARRRWSARAPSSGARSPRVSGGRSPTAPWSATDGEMAPAAALAALLAARLC